MYAITATTKAAPIAPFALRAQAPEARDERGAGEGRAPARMAGTFSGTAAATLKFDRNETIYYEGDEAEACYKVVSGMVRLCKLTEDGRRQITAFLMPGDMFGWTDLETHSFSAEAVTEARVEKVSRARIEDGMRTNPAMGRGFLSMISSQLAAAHDHLLLLGRMTAAERIAWFLLDLSKRAKAAGMKAGALDLVMNRKDIADYLGLTIETVSRMLNQMKRKGLIGLATPDHVEFTRAGALERLAMAA
ncbi:MAG: cyclic nucleotide-binding domain-containing protein [Rhodospirillaceae bacterium]|nr:cyclic nucleotide-binding domain-containing protein [Rhodospirillaceae bacterium]